MIKRTFVVKIEISINENSFGEPELSNFKNYTTEEIISNLQETIGYKSKDLSAIIISCVEEK